MCVCVCVCVCNFNLHSILDQRLCCPVQKLCFVLMIRSCQPCVSLHMVTLRAIHFQKSTWSMLPRAIHKVSKTYSEWLQHFVLKYFNAIVTQQKASFSHRVQHQTVFVLAAQPQHIITKNLPQFQLIAMAGSNFI